MTSALGISNLERTPPEVLRKIGEQGLRPLIQALEDKDERVRWDAAEALGDIKDARAVEPLIKALEDEHWDVVRHAAEVLGMIGDARAVKPLTQAMKRERGHATADVLKEALKYIKRRG